MPEIPEGKNRPTIEETVIDLLESIALEEMAISHVLNAEGEKLQVVVNKYRDDEICIEQLGQVSRGINRMFTDLIMKQWLLIVKLNHVEDLAEKYSLKFNCAHSVLGHKSCNPKGDKDINVNLCGQCSNRSYKTAICEECERRQSCSCYYNWSKGE